MIVTRDAALRARIEIDEVEADAVARDHHEPLDALQAGRGHQRREVVQPVEVAQQLRPQRAHVRGRGTPTRRRALRAASRESARRSSDPSSLTTSRVTPTLNRSSCMPYDRFSFTTGKGHAVTEQIVVGELPVGGTEPLISSAIPWGDLLFLSGRAPIDTSTMEVVSDDFEEQARDVLDRSATRFAEAGSGSSTCSASSATCSTPRTSARGTRSGRSTFPPPRPVRTTIVTGFTVPRMLIEIEVTAGIPS